MFIIILSWRCQASYRIEEETRAIIPLPVPSYTVLIEGYDETISKFGLDPMELKAMVANELRLTSPMLLASKSLMAVPRNTPPGRRTHRIEAAQLSWKPRSWSINCTTRIKIHVNWATSGIGWRTRRCSCQRLRIVVRSWWGLEYWKISLFG